MRYTWRNPFGYVISAVTTHPTHTFTLKFKYFINKPFPINNSAEKLYAVVFTSRDKSVAQFNDT